MTAEEIIEIEKRAVNTYGIEPQMRMLQEECGELIVAVGHYLRGRKNSLENLIEELADVKIMINQIVIGLDANESATEMLNFKLNRLKKRLEEHKNIR